MMNWNPWGNDRRRTLTPGEKKYLLLQARGKCEYCGGDITANGVKEEIHHIVPFASRGSDNYHNLIVLCPNCHSKAEHISKEAFRLKIAYRLSKPGSVQATPEKAAPKKAVAKKAAPKKAVAKKAASKKAVAKKVAPKKAAPQKVVAKKAGPKKK